MTLKPSHESLEKRIRELENENAELRRKQHTLSNQIVSLTSPKDTGRDIIFEDLFNIDIIQRIQDEFSKVTHVASIITRIDGTPITEPSNFCRLCQDVIRQTEIGRANCFKSDTVIGQFNPDGPNLLPCKSGGLYDAGAGITVGGKHIANWLIGQVRDELQTEEQMLEYARKIGADEREMIEAFHEVPIMSREQFGNIAQFLFSLANQLSGIAYQNVLQARLIFDRKRAKKELQKKENTLKSILITAPIGISMTIDRKFTWVNQQMCKMLCYSESELLNKSTRILHQTEEGFDSIGRKMHSQISKNDISTTEVRWRRKDGESIDVLLCATLLNQDDWSQGLVCTALDISNRKKAEEALQQSEERFRVAFHTSPDAISITQISDGVFIDMNEGFNRIFGYSRKDVIGKSSHSLNIWNNIEDRKRLEEALIEKGYVENLETEFVSKNGGLIVGLMSVSRLEINGESVLLSVTRDISERKQIENELKEYREHLEDLVQQRTIALETKNKEMETFTYSVSHDLKAPLRGIDGYSRLLEEEYADKLDEEGSLFLKNVRQSATQMNQLIEDLLAYSRMERRDVQFVSIDLPLMINNLINQRVFDLETKQIEVSVNLPFQTVYSDIETVRQVITNFLDNAIKFSRPNPPKTVEIKGREDNKSWIFWVKDNGIGFDQGYTDRIFEIFQRLHRAEDFPGTGIGLAIVKKAVERIGGRCWAESSLGEGATFFIEIPKRAKES